MIAVVLFGRGGVIGLLHARPQVMTALLDIQGLRKTFGGLVATRDVSLAVPAGELHALDRAERRGQDDADHAALR